MTELFVADSIDARVRDCLEQTLASWREWHTGAVKLSAQPTVLRDLGGTTNCSFLITSGEFRAVLRVNAENSASLGIDRQRELTILQCLQPTAAVPQLFYSTERVLVSAFVEGHPPSTDSPAQVMVEITHVLAKIQQVNVPQLERRNYVDYCQAYLDQLNDQPVGRALRDRLLEAAACIDSAPWSAVICHHDLIAENIIITANGPVILDWEYAALGHPALDYMRLLGGQIPDAACLGVDQKITEKLAILQRGMDDLWLLLQCQR